MLVEMIREMMQGGQPARRQLSRGLWIIYKPVHGMHRLVIARQEQWPGPEERETVAKCIKQASQGDVDIKWTPREANGRNTGKQYYGYQTTWTALVSAKVIVTL
jgi:hypothetical protein